MVSSSPHIRDRVNTRKIMIDVIIALLPATFAGVYFLEQGFYLWLWSAFYPALHRSI